MHARVVMHVLVAALGVARALTAQRLRLVEFTTDSASLNVVSALIMHGHLKAIFITHPDEDHYFGALAFVQGFPGTPMYVTPRDFTMPSNSFVWIPSLRAVIAGDLVFTQVHAYLGSVDHAAREEWRRSLEHITTLHPAIVVGGTSGRERAIRRMF